MKSKEGPLLKLEELEKCEQEKASILNSLSEEITHLDMEMRVTWINKAASESAGLAPKQLVGCYCYDVWCQNGEPRADCPAVRTIRTGQREEGEISTPDGRTLLHRSCPIRDAKGNMTGIVIITLNITEQKQSEKVLRERENAYRTLAENLPGIVYRVFIRENNRMQFFNKMLKPMTGCTAEELSSGVVCSIEPMILSEDRGAVVKAVKRAILDHQPFEVEYRLRNREGDIRYFLERGKPVYGIDEKPLYLDGVILDITERKMAEEGLKKSEQEKALILSATQEAIGLVDTSLRVIWANKVCADRAALLPEQMAGRYCYEMWAQRSGPCVGCPALKSIETGRSEESEIPSPDGRIWLHRAYPIQNPGGRIEGIVATATDIHERKQNEEKLREHAQILDQVHDSVISTDMDGYVVTWNKGAERIFGYSAEEGVGKHISFVYPPDQHEFLRHEVIEPLKKKGRHEIEVKMRRKSGEDFYAHLSLSLLKNREGLDIGMIGSSVDISERKQMEGSLRTSHAELEIRVEERTKELRAEISQRKLTEEALRESEKRLRFLSSQLITVQEQERKRIASELHDSLAAALSGIKYKVEAALHQRGKNKHKAVEEQLESVILMIQECVEEVRRIQMDLRPATLDNLGILATIRWFCHKFQTIYPSISIEQQIEVHEDEVPVSLKTVIYRISQEALNNVAKHSQADHVSLSLKRIEERIELVIQDNGRGFNPEEALSSESPGRGFGVISMRERAELSGGTFSVEVTPGAGTMIRASWPIRLSQE